MALMGHRGNKTCSYGARTEIGPRLEPLTPPPLASASTGLSLNPGICRRQRPCGFSHRARRIIWREPVGQVGKMTCRSAQGGARSACLLTEMIEAAEQAQELTDGYQCE